MLNQLATLLLASLITLHPQYGYQAVEEWKMQEYQRCIAVVEAEKEVKQTTTTTYVPTTTAGDLGILSIPAANINVGLYSDGNAFQASGKASVQYYNQYGIKWIADHVNQDHFGNLKNLPIGSTVYVNDTAYTVVENVYAADYYSNFSAWVSYIGDSTLILQTCEGDGARLVRCQ